MFNKVVIVGLGLIGGSLCLALRDMRLARHIVGYDLDGDTLKEAVNAKIVNEIRADLKEAVSLAMGKEDLIVIAVPLSATEEVLAACHSADTQATMIDVGSAKQHLMPLLRSLWGFIPANFVPTHPIAGSEKKRLSGSGRTTLSQSQAYHSAL